VEVEEEVEEEEEVDDDVDVEEEVEEEVEDDVDVEEEVAVVGRSFLSVVPASKISPTTEGPTTSRKSLHTKSSFWLST
jgi:hypothetical protein